MNLVKKSEKETPSTDAPNVSTVSKGARKRMRKAITKAAGAEVDQPGQSPLTKESSTNASVTRARQADINVAATENQAKKKLRIESGANPVVTTLNENQLAKENKLQSMMKKIEKRSPASQKLQKNKPKNNKGAFKKQQPKIDSKDLNNDDADDHDVEADSNEELNAEEVTIIKPAKSETLNAAEEENKSDESSSEGELQIQGKNQSAIKKLSVTDQRVARVLKKAKSRYVVFVGNLPFAATKEEVIAHFKVTCDVIDVRIPIDKDSNQPRGFAYVEMPNEKEYHKALSLHHSFFHKRRINVLYTRAGLKKASGREQEIKHKNYKLQSMRRKGQLPGGFTDSQKRAARRAKKQAFDRKSE